MTLKELAKAAEAAQEKAWEANNAAWAAWQAAFDLAQDARPPYLGPQCGAAGE